MLRFRRMRSLQMFASVHSSVHNHFNLERHLFTRDDFKENRTAALAEWRSLTVGAPVPNGDLCVSPDSTRMRVAQSFDSALRKA